jgi:negative regulator of replication initiation
MMPTMRVDDEIWAFLKKHAEPFEDTPNDVLKRLLLGSAAISKTSPTRSPAVSVSSISPTFRPDQEYTHRRTGGFWLFGNRHDARSFHDLLIEFSRELRKADNQGFERAALSLRGTKRTYFSRNAGELKKPEDLGGGLFVETNLNANILVGICRALLKELGHDPDDLRVDVI